MNELGKAESKTIEFQGQSSNYLYKFFHSYLYEDLQTKPVAVFYI